MVRPDPGSGNGGSPGRSTDVSLAPFEKHPASLGELEEVAGQFATLAGRGVDLEAVTDDRFTPAEASWDGMAAPELRAAPQPVRERAERAVGALAWAAGPIQYWSEQVRLFNSQVDTIEGERSEARSDNWGVEDGASEQEVTLARSGHESEMRRRWWDAHQQFIDEGAQTAAAMLREGPTAANLALLAEAGIWERPTGAAAVFLPQWHDRAMSDLADETIDLINRINDPNYRPTEEELAQLDEVLKEYADDEAFAFHLLDGLGPEGLLSLTGHVALMQVDEGHGRLDEDLAALVGSIQAGLGVALATATTRRGTEPPYPGARYVPGRYELDSDWRVELLQLGRQQLYLNQAEPSVGGISAQIYGHQLLGVLLQSPEAEFDSSFLNLVGSDMLDFETRGGWSEQGDGLPIWHDNRATVGVLPVQLNWMPGGAGNDGYDPVVGLMSALERNPDAAREFFTSQVLFDGTEGGRLPRVDYLLTDREWLPDYISNPDVDLNGATPGQLLLGDALVNATTDNPDERSDRIVESIIYEIATDEQARGYPNNPLGDGGEGEQAGRFRESDILPDALREKMADIASFYIDDMHWNVLGRAAPDGAPGDPTIDATERHTQVFLAELGKNQEARDQIQAAEALYAGMVYDYYLSQDGDASMSDRLAEAEQFAGRPAGLIFGATDFGHASETVNAQNEADTAYNDALRNKYFLAGLVIDQATDRLPGPFGSVISEGLDRAEEAQQADRIGDANYDVGDLRQRGRDAIQAMADAAVYRNLTEEQVASLPDRLFYQEGPNAGEPIPYGEWGREEQQAWDGYITEPGSGLGTIDDLDRRYDEGYDRAQGDLEGY